MKKILGAVTMLLVLGLGCKKNNNGPAGNPYVAKMKGAKKWHGYFYYAYYHDNGLHTGPTAYWDTVNIADTVFALNVINDTSISLFGDTLSYLKTDTAATLHFYKITNTNTYLIYYKAGDSMVYNYRYSYNVWPNDTERTWHLVTP